MILAGFLVEGFLYGIVTSSDGLGPNLITEAMGIGFTVVVIDWMYEWRAKRDLKRRLIREAGSRSNDIAISAIEYLRDEQWLCGGQGLLAGADLAHANLKEVDLNNANLVKVNLFWAQLELAELIDADLQATILKEQACLEYPCIEPI